MIRFSVILLLMLGASASTKPSSRPGGEITPPPKRDVPGQRITLPCGELFIPDFFLASRDKPSELLIWSLGAAWLAEQNFYDSRKNAVLLVLNGATTKVGFADASKFTELLAQVSAALDKQSPGCAPVGKVALGSFSGGYPAIWDILRHKELFPMISDVVLADSLYAPKVKGSQTELEPAAMEPFLNYAQRAARGEAQFFFSHLYPPDPQYRGNGTTLTASYLIDHIGATRVPATGANSVGAKLLYRADLKGFHVLGYAGMLNQDHFNHFYGSADLIRLTSLDDAAR